MYLLIVAHILAHTIQNKYLLPLQNANPLVPLPTIMLLLHVILQDGNTPLHWAAAEGTIDTVNMLLAHGADVNIPNNVSVCATVCMCGTVYVVTAMMT